MSSNHLRVRIYSPEEFQAQQAAGNFNTKLTYQRYVELQHLRAERARHEWEALDPHDRAALEQLLATRAEEEDQPQPAAA
ncbi:MAG TPA: hypothetical protein VFZ34_06635 [Blastocatellia bacterium]|nr:hypothetical protein [Blastocatellia bacterium]